MRPGSVIAYQKTKTPASSRTWYRAKRPRDGRRLALLVPCSPLLLAGSGIAFQNLVLHLVPDLRVQLDEARREADLVDVARPRQVDRVLTDAVSPWPRREHDHPVGERDRLLQI